MVNLIWRGVVKDIGFSSKAPIVARSGPVVLHCVSG